MRRNIAQDEEVFAKASTALVDILHFTGRYEEAEAAYIENLAILKKRGAPPFLFLLPPLANVLVAMEKWAEALMYRLEAEQA